MKSKSTESLKSLISTIFVIIFFQIVALPQTVPAVVVDYSINATVSSTNKLSAEYNRVVRINSAAGIEFGEMVIHYSSIEKVKNLEVSILDANQDLVRTLKNNEIKDISAYSKYFYEDDRMKIIQPAYTSYPYYVVYSYTIETREFLNLPVWGPFFYNLNIIHSSYSLTVPDDFKFNFKFYNIEPDSPGITENDNKKTYRWEFELIEPIDELERSLPVKWRIPYGYFVPEKFVFDGVEGSFNTWKDYGLWTTKILEGKDVLPEAEKLRVKKLVSDCKTEIEKVEVIHQNMLQDIRYVNVMIGTGGLVPHPATYVCNNKYGDCKALVNYTKALLKSVGINSYFSLVYAGTDHAPTDSGFVSQSFNHVILYVPVDGKDYWLECTPNETPFGYLSRSIQGKPTLICMGEESHLAHIPKAGTDENSSTLKATVELEGKKLKAKVNRHLKGIFYETVFRRKNHYDEEDFNTWLKLYLPYNRFEVERISYEVFDDEPTMIEESEISVKKHLIELDDEMYIKQFHRITNLDEPKDSIREIGYYIPDSFSKIDTVYYKIPAGYRILQIPEVFSISNDFGEYSIKSKALDQDVLIVKSIEVTNGIYKNEKYDELIGFIDEVNKHDNKVIIIKKKNE